MIQTIYLVSILLAACCQDLLTYRISNDLIVLGLLGGALAALLSGSFSAIASCALGALLPIALLWLLYRIRALGAGDIKLLSVCGSFLGTGGIFRVIVASLFAGGVLGLWLLIKKRSIHAKMHFSIAILLGTIYVLLAGGR